jgi:2-dehydropantoate 2-reductase
MRIAVFGAGGVGGYFGGRLAASGADVTFIARGTQLEALRARGLRIESPKGDVTVRPVQVMGAPARLGPVDVVMFTVKMYDAEAASAALPPLVGPGTVVIPFQNGVESVDILTRAIGRDAVAGGTAYVAAVVSEPGVIKHTAMDSLIFGELDGTRSPRLERFLAACQPAGFQATLSTNIHADIWAKFIRLTVFSGMTSITRMPLGTSREDPDLFAMMEAAWQEGLAVARARGVTLAPGLLDEIRQMTASLPPHAKSSMLEDLERGKRLELPWLSGAIVRLGETVGVPTPTHRIINAVLRPHVNGDKSVHQHEAHEDLKAMKKSPV